MTESMDGFSSPRGAETTGRIIVALFQDRGQAEDAIRELKNAGLTNEHIGVATQDRVEGISGADPGEGASAGALTGGVIGGLLGLISSLLIPGVGPLVIGGVLASTIMGMGVGAATGGLIGALVGMGVSEGDARYFDAGIREGRTLVTVSSTNQDPVAAMSILERRGGDLGPSRLAPRGMDGYRGEERRSRSDGAYSGPERRLVGI
jgi:uncharacterized membrane protein